MDVGLGGGWSKVVWVWWGLGCCGHHVDNHDVLGKDKSWCPVTMLLLLLLLLLGVVHQIYDQLSSTQFFAAHIRLQVASTLLLLLATHHRACYQ
jgi:hypothetical protein